MKSIQWTSETVKALHLELQKAYAAGNKRLVRRLSVLLGIGQYQISVQEVAMTWGISLAIVYRWIDNFLNEPVESLLYRPTRGRPCKLTPAQKQRLCRNSGCAETAAVPIAGRGTTNRGF